MPNSAALLLCRHAPGAADLQELKRHPFFKAIDWGSLRKQPAPEFVPPEPDLSGAAAARGVCAAGGERLAGSQPLCTPCREASRACAPASELHPNTSLPRPAALSSANSSFDWELQSLASALPHVGSTEDTLALEGSP